jgi:hypothetical protein
MRGNKKLLLGIAIILFAIATGGILLEIGWGISLFGLIVSISGYFSEEE